MAVSSPCVGIRAEARTLVRSHHLQNRPQIRVPHLGDGSIVSKVGSSPTRSSRQGGNARLLQPVIALCAVVFAAVLAAFVALAAVVILAVAVVLAVAVEIGPGFRGC